VRIRRVGSVRAMERMIDEMITLGYDVQHRGEETALLKKRTWGSVGVIIVLLIIAFVFVGITLGLSFLLPIAYAVYSHQTAETVEIKVDRSTDVAGPAAQPPAYAPPSEAQPSRQTPPPPGV